MIYVKSRYLIKKTKKMRNLLNNESEMLQNSSSMQSEHAERRGVKEDDDLQSRSLVVMT